MGSEPKLLLMIKKLSVSLFTQLSDEDKQLMGQNLYEVLSLDSESTVNIFSTLYESFEKLKSEYLGSSTKHKFQENESYQKELQKLESEIRNHFKSELEMKILIDGLDEKTKDFNTENLTVMEQNYSAIDNILKSNKKVKASIRQKMQEIEDLKSIGNPPLEKDLLLSRVKKELESIQELSAINHKYYKKFIKAKNNLESENKKYSRLKKDFFELKSLSSIKPDFSSFTTDLSQESLEIKTYRISRTPDLSENSLSPIPQSKKKQSNRIGKNFNRVEKSPFFKSSEKRKSKKSSKMVRTPNKSILTK